MREFRYTALTTAGDTVAGIRRAPSADVLSEELFSQNLILVNSRQTLGSLGRRFSLAARAGRRELLDFTLHMSTSLGAGIPVTSALRDFEHESASGPFKNIIADIREEISSGAQVAEALSKHPEVFSDVYLAVIAAGQDSGDLARAFSDLVDHLEWLDDLHGKTKQALVYPAILACGVVGLFLLMLLYVLPRFMEIFQGQQFQLPTLTTNIIAGFEWFKYWWPFLLGCAAGAVVAFRLFHRSARGRMVVDGLLLRLPVVGKFVHKLALSRFARHFALLFAAGTSLLRILELLEKVVGNAVLELELKNIRERVVTGETLTSAFAHNRSFPALIQRLVSVGEQTGRLDHTLAKAAEYLDKEIPRALKQAFTVFEAIIIAILGALIAVAAMSILLPILQMRTQL